MTLEETDSGFPPGLSDLQVPGLKVSVVESFKS